MLAYMRKKKEKVSGPVRKMPVYQGPQPPPNRFVKKCLQYYCIVFDFSVVPGLCFMDNSIGLVSF